MFKIAIAKLDSDGYNYKKKKSRSKLISNAGQDLQDKPPKKISQEIRTKRINELNEDLKEVDLQLDLCEKQRIKQTNVKQYAQAITLTEQISELRIKKRKLQNELANLQRKESKSVAYKRKTSQKCSTDGYSGKSSKQIDVMLKRRAPDHPDNDELCIVAKRKSIVVEETESKQSPDNDDGRVEATSSGQQEKQQEVQPVTKRKSIVVEETESEQNPDNVDDRFEEPASGQQENQQEVQPEKKQENIPSENTQDETPFLEKTEYLL
ncbi:uncharacterized protein LOC114543950 [Dendronephthya gigantea]|uniref:uncharacterized protein LOC114543950 n=1 Tax=Dendronephthya gigantea TaxID=151771 RepID=UPI0010694E2A|nr:uncharacterized protein LOC114543950 [Dendronephthya gigantea]